MSLSDDAPSIWGTSVCTKQCAGCWVHKLPIVLDLQREPESRSLHHVLVKWEVLTETQLVVHQFCPRGVRESTER